MGRESTEPALPRVLDTLTKRLRPYVPLTALNLVWKSLDKGAKSILDIGCGKGEPMAFINRAEGFYTTGVDIFKPYLMSAKVGKFHDDYILCDARALPIRRKSFDVVVCLEVLEHLARREGKELMRTMEQIARRQVIVTTPAGIYEQRPLDHNPFQEHKYIWTPSDLKSLGHRVMGTGIRGVGGDCGISARTGRIFDIILYPIYVLAGLFTYFLPSLSGHMVSVKTLSNESHYFARRHVLHPFSDLRMWATLVRVP